MNYMWKAVLNNGKSTRYFSDLSFLTTHLYRETPMNLCDNCKIYGIPNNETVKRVDIEYHGRTGGMIALNEPAKKLFATCQW